MSKIKIIQGDITKLAAHSSSTLPTPHCWAAEGWTAQFTARPAGNCWRNAGYWAAAKPGRQK